MLKPNTSRFQNLCKYALCCFVHLNVLFFSNILLAAETVCSTNGGPGWAVGNATDVIVENFQFPDPTIPIADLDVDMDISHTWIGDLDVTATSPNATAVLLFNRPGVVANPPWGCNGDDLDVLFSDEAGTGNIDPICAGATPTIAGTYEPWNANTLSNFDGEFPDGNWTFTFNDAYTAADAGTLNEVCLVVSKTLEFDKWVSTNPTCTDQVDSLSVPSGTTIYYCYTVTNNGTTALTVDNAVDDQGIDISALEHSYAAGASDTVIQSGVTGINFPIGVTVNTATVTSGTMTAVETATLSVPTTVATQGSKPLYLWSSTGLDLYRTPPTAAEARIQINGNGANRTWTMSPTSYSPITIDGSAGIITVTLVLTEVGPGTNRTVVATLGYDDPGTTIVGSLSLPLTLTGIPTAYNFDVPVAGDFTMASGGALTLTVTNNSGTNNQRIRVYPWQTAALYSSVQYTSKTVINTDGVTFYDAPYPGGTKLNGGVPGQNVYIRGLISDPFGSFDITSAALTLKDPTMTPVLTGVAMTEIIDSGTDNKTYEYGPYTIPAAFGSNGSWRAEVTGTEGTEAVPVTHMGYGDLLVGTPTLTIVKSASAASSPVGTANPGEEVTYSILVTNTGNGYAENVILNDNFSSYVFFGIDGYGINDPYQLTQGVPPSGLSLGIPTYSDDNGATWTYSPSSGAGGAPAGFDGNATDWRLPLLGPMAPGGSFTLKYKTRVR